MSLETQSVMETVMPQSPQLPYPVDDPTSDRSPVIFVVRLPNYVLTMAVANTFFRQRFVAGRIRCAPDSGRVSWIPVQHKIPVGNRFQHVRCLLARCGVAGHLVLEQQ